MITASEIIELLKLEHHPQEGGYYAETFRSEIQVPTHHLPSSYKSARCLTTSIYYLLTPETFSELHALPTEELFHFYLGDPVEMLQLLPDGSGRLLTLGTDLASGERPQPTVPADVWQGSRLASGGQLALLGACVSPGFEFEDYRAGNRERLQRAYPRYHELIAALTHAPR